MRHIRTFTIALVLAVILLTLTQPGAALAASWTYTTDFDSFPVGWSDMTGNCGVTINPTGNNFREATIAAYGDGSVLAAQYGRKISVTFQLDEPVTITAVGMTGDMGSGDSDSQYMQIIACESDDVTTHYVDATGNGITISETPGWTDIEWITVFTTPSSGLGLCLIDAESGYGTTPPCHYPWVDNFTITADADEDPFDGVGGSGAGSGLTRPVLTTDELEVDTAPEPDTITAVDRAWVHAAASGVITQISPTGGSYLVTVDSDTYHARYTNLAFVYGSVGDEINGGCILGQAGEPIFETVAEYDDPISQVGFHIDDGVDDLAWQSFPDPTSSAGCSDAFSTAHCLTANPKLNSYAARWFTSGFPDGETVLLEQGEKLAQALVLTSGTEYYLTVIARTESPVVGQQATPAVLKLTLGDVLETIEFQPKDSEFVVVEIGPLTPTTPDQPPDVYDLVLTVPDYSLPVEVTFVCLHLGDVVVSPDHCYFVGPRFGFDGDPAWTLSGGATENFIGYYWEIPQNDYMSQPLLISGYADSDADYRIRISGATDVADVTFSFDDIASFFSAAFETTLLMTYDVSGTPVETLGTIDLTNIIFFRNYEATFTVPEDETWDGDFVATNDSAETRRILIDTFCLNPVSGVWPGFEDADSGPANPSGCFFPTAPSTFNVAQWLAYIGEMLLWIWQCGIERLLLQIISGATGGLVGLGMLGRYLGALSAWVTSFALGLVLGALQALLNSLAAVFGAAWALLAEMPLLQLLYDLLGLAVLAMTLLGTLIQSLLSLFASLAAFLGIGLTVAANIWVELVTNINSATAPDVGMANCGNPSDPLIGICYGLAAVAGFFTEFPALVASTVVMAGCLCLYTITWTIRTIGQALGDI